MDTLFPKTKCLDIFFFFHIEIHLYFLLFNMTKISSFNYFWDIYLVCTTQSIDIFAVNCFENTF